MVERCPNYGWGIYDHFYFSTAEALSIPTYNLQSKINVMQFENYQPENDTNRQTQIESWKKNQQYLLKYLEHYKLSKFYATGSYYYIAFKAFSIKSLNFRLIIFYFKLMIKFFISLFFKLIRR